MRWRFLLLTWTLRLQQCTCTGLKESSLGQMSLSPRNGAMVMVFLCSDSGRLLLSAPSRKSCGVRPTPSVLGPEGPEALVLQPLPVLTSPR